MCSPLGPYTFRGSLMWNPPGNCGNVQGSSSDALPCAPQASTTGGNNHQGIVEFPVGSGSLYMAYHTRGLAHSRNAYFGYQRNVAVDRLYARGDAGVFPLPLNLSWVVNEGAPGAGAGLLPVSATPRWVRQLKYVDPYARVSAALSAAMSAGLDTEPCAEGGRFLRFISDGSVLSLAGVDFGATSAAAVTLRAATPLAGGTVTVLVDGAPAGAPCSVPATGDWQVFGNVTCPLFAGGPAVGVAANLSFVVHGVAGGAGLMNMLFWAFHGGAAGGVAPPPVAVRVALRAAATGLFLCAAGDAGAVVTPSGGAPCNWTLRELGDGTWALSTARGAGGGEHFACISSAGGALAVTKDAAGSGACTRFWLYGTTAGSYAILSAGAGSFLVAKADPAAPVAAGAADPRRTVADGARFFIEELPPSAAPRA
jgi:hypothetical protein